MEGIRRSLLLRHLHELQSLDEIAKAIQYIADHPNEARQVGENGRRVVEQEFNWETGKENFLSTYEDLLEP